MTRVVIAMSGGVDSSAAACLLKEQGYDVIGITMKLPNTGESSPLGCCGIKGAEDARGVAQTLDIPFYLVDFEHEFNEIVIRSFCEEYLRGRTPNPCILCNERVKLGSLLEKAKKLGADYIATGHYARVVEHKNRFLIKKAVDAQKDQSYFLFSLKQNQLRHLLFPLGGYTKQEVRVLAKSRGLAVHAKPGSQEICFVRGHYADFITDWLKKNKVTLQRARPGKILDSSGNEAGTHTGITNYTVGQRKGIGSHKAPCFVLSIDGGKNTIIIGEEEKLFSDELLAGNVNWLDREILEKPIEVKARIRYRHTESEATVYPAENNRVKVKFKQTQRAITPGQAVVFYQGDLLIGGGWIQGH